MILCAAAGTYLMLLLCRERCEWVNAVYNFGRWIQKECGRDHEMSRGDRPLVGDLIFYRSIHSTLTHTFISNSSSQTLSLARDKLRPHCKEGQVTILAVQYFISVRCLPPLCVSGGACCGVVDKTPYGQTGMHLLTHYLQNPTKVCSGNLTFFFIFDFLFNYWKLAYYKTCIFHNYIFNFVVLHRHSIIIKYRKNW